MESRLAHRRKECVNETQDIGCPYCKFVGHGEAYREHDKTCLKGVDECVLCRNLYTQFCITCEAEGNKTKVCQTSPNTSKSKNVIFER